MDIKIAGGNLEPQNCFGWKIPLRLSSLSTTDLHGSAEKQDSLEIQQQKEAKAIARLPP